MDNHAYLPPDPKGILDTAVSVKPFTSLQEKQNDIFFFKKIGMLRDNNSKKLCLSEY